MENEVECLIHQYEAEILDINNHVKTIYHEKGKAFPSAALMLMMEEKRTLERVVKDLKQLERIIKKEKHK